MAIKAEKASSIKMPAVQYRRYSMRAETAAPAATDDPNAPIAFSALLATEAPCRSFYEDYGEVDEILPMAGIDMSRTVAAPLPMLYDHNAADLEIGSWSNLKIDTSAGTLTGDGLQTRTEGTVCGRTVDGKAQANPQPISALRDNIRRRLARGASIGYRINRAIIIPKGQTRDKYAAVDRTIVLGVSWELLEASLTSVQEDAATVVRSAAGSGRLINVPCEIGTRANKTGRARAMDEAMKAAFKAMDEEGVKAFAKSLKADAPDFLKALRAATDEKPAGDSAEAEANDSADDLPVAAKAAAGTKTRAAATKAAPVVEEAAPEAGTPEYERQFAETIGDLPKASRSLFYDVHHGNPLDKVRKAADHEGRHVSRGQNFRSAPAGARGSDQPRVSDEPTADEVKKAAEQFKAGDD